MYLSPFTLAPRAAVLWNGSTHDHASVYRDRSDERLGSVQRKLRYPLLRRATLPGREANLASTKTEIGPDLIPETSLLIFLYFSVRRITVTLSCGRVMVNGFFSIKLRLDTCGKTRFGSTSSFIT